MFRLALSRFRLTLKMVRLNLIIRASFSFEDSVLRLSKGFGTLCEHGLRSLISK